MKASHFITLLLFITGYFAYKIFYPFLEQIVIAILLSLATYNMNVYFLKRIKYKIPSALLSTIVISILFFVPLIYLITNAATAITHMDINHIKEIYLDLHDKIMNYFSHNSFFQKYISKYIQNIDINETFQKLVQIASFLAAKSAKFLKDTVLILIFYFFINLYGKELLLYFQKISPLAKKESSKIFDDLTSVMGVVFNSIIATAFLEGAMFGIIARIYGYDGLMFGVMYGFSSLIPVIGGVIMWVPLSLHQFALGHTSAAITIALYSIIMISIVADTFIKPMIIAYIDQSAGKKTYINELLIFFSIVAGIASYGFWGMILGPAVLTLFISILNIYPNIKD